MCCAATIGCEDHNIKLITPTVDGTDLALQANCAQVLFWVLRCIFGSKLPESLDHIEQYYMTVAGEDLEIV